jgi:hypothetical protein
MRWPDKGQAQPAPAPPVTRGIPHHLTRGPASTIFRALFGPVGQKHFRGRPLLPERDRSASKDNFA